MTMLRIEDYMDGLELAKLYSAVLRVYNEINNSCEAWEPADEQVRELARIADELHNVGN